MRAASDELLLTLSRQQQQPCRQVYITGYLHRTHERHHHHHHYQQQQQQQQDCTSHATGEEMQLDS